MQCTKSYRVISVLIFVTNLGDGARVAEHGEGEAVPGAGALAAAREAAEPGQGGLAVRQGEDQGPAEPLVAAAGPAAPAAGAAQGVRGPDRPRQQRGRQGRARAPAATQEQHREHHHPQSPGGTAVIRLLATTRAWNHLLPSIQTFNRWQ